MMDINRNPSRKELLAFAVFLGLLTALIGYFCHRGGHQGAARGLWAAALPVALAGGALCFKAPAIMRALWIGWLTVTYPIGWVVTHVALALLFYLLVTPIGLMSRVFGHDPLQLTIDREADTYWVERDAASDPSRCFKQY